MQVRIAFERPEPQELAALLSAAGWGHHELDALRRSIHAFTETVCARDFSNKLVGYISVFTDQVLSTMFGEVLVHPAVQRHGVGRAMLRAVEERFPLPPIYVKALAESRGFFEAVGYKVSSPPVTTVFKKPVASAGALSFAEQYGGAA